jgi:hypothetical protein
LRFLVTTKVFDTIQSKTDLERQAQLVKEQIKVIMNSGKLVQGGQFADNRGHFFLLDIDNEGELLQLLGRGLLDSCKVESHPIVPFDNLFEFFQNNPVR